MELKHTLYHIYGVDANGNTVAEITFPPINETTVDIDHTFVDDSLKGQGIAGQLVAAAAEDIRKAGKKTRTSCSYAAHWFTKHPEYQDILE